MEKSKLEDFVNALKDAGVEEYSLRVEGGNRTVRNDDNSKIIIRTADIVVLEKSRNYGSDTGNYVISVIPFENIDNAKVIDTTVSETIKILTNLDVYDDTTKEFIQTHPIKSHIIPTNAGLDVIRDEKGKATVPNGSAGYLTYGAIDDVK